MNAVGFLIESEFKEFIKLVYKFTENRLNLDKIISKHF